MGGATALSMFAAGEVDKGSISIQAAVGVVIFVGGSSWWISGKFNKIEQSISELHRRIDGIPGANKQHKHKEEEEY